MLPRFPFYLPFCCIFVACMPAVHIKLADKNRKPLNTHARVDIYREGQVVPDDSKLVGTIKIRAGSLSCFTESSIMELARMKTRKVGANTLRVTKFTVPGKIRNATTFHAEMLYLANLSGDSLSVAAPFTKGEIEYGKVLTINESLKYPENPYAARHWALDTINRMIFETSFKAGLTLVLPGALTLPFEKNTGLGLLGMGGIFIGISIPFHFFSKMHERKARKIDDTWFKQD